MSHLLHRPFGDHGEVHRITPENARWRYVGFSLYRLRRGERAAERTLHCEVILVMVEGKACISGAGQDWGVLGERMDVFEKSPPHCLYLPNGTDWEAVAETGHTHSALAAFLTDIATVIRPVELNFLWRPQLADPDDEMVLEAAVNGQADAIITFNTKDFSPEAQRFGIDLLTPAEALKRISE